MTDPKTPTDKARIIRLAAEVLRELLPSNTVRCFKPANGPYQDRRFYARRIVWQWGELMVLGNESGASQDTVQPVASLLSDWEPVS